jgi:formylglycine-generating enzyme required for sulfatase activity
MKTLPSGRLALSVLILVFGLLAISGRADTWTKADQSGQTAYFPHPSPPRVERYDMATETWLAPIALPAVSTAVAADTNALFVACGQTVYRMGLDGSEATELVTHTNTITELVLAGDTLVFQSGFVIASLDKSSGILRDMRQYYLHFESLAYTPEPRQLLGITKEGGWPEFLQSMFPIEVFPNGGLAKQQSTGTTVGLASNTLARVTTDGRRIITASGMVLNTSDLSEAGKLDVKVSDISFNGDVIVALRGSNVLAYANTLQPTGSKSLPFLPVRVFTTKEAAFAFGHSMTGPSTVARVPWSDLHAPEPGTPADPTSVSFLPDAVDSDTNGVVYLLSGKFRSVFRWSATSRSFLRTIPTIDEAITMAVSSTLDRIYLGYKNGRITIVDLSRPNPAEAPFNSTLSSLQLIVVAGDDLLVAGPNSDVRAIALDANGQLRSELKYQFFQPRSIWAPKKHRIYSAENAYLKWIGYTNGTYLTPDSRYLNDYDMQGVAALSPDESLLLASSGSVVDLGSLSITNSLGISVADAVWGQEGLQTLRAIGGYYQVHRWNSLFEPLLFRQALGMPFRMLPMDTNLVVVASNNGQVQFTLLDKSLEPVFVSPIRSGPTNIAFSTSVIPPFLAADSVVGTVAAHDPETNTPPKLSLIDSANGRFYLEGDHLRSSYEQTFDPGTTYFVVIRAENTVGAGISRTFQLSVSTGPIPEVSMSLRKPDLFENSTVDSVIELHRTGDLSKELNVVVQMGGTASWNSDYWLFGTTYGPAGDTFGFRFARGSNTLAVSVSVNGFDDQELSETITFTVLATADYEVSVPSSLSGTIWDSKLERWLYLRNGRPVSQAESAPDADPDGNGVPNFVEFHSGAPAAPTNGYVRPFASLDPVAQRLAVVFHRDPSLTDAERDLLVSSNLVNWSQAIPEERILATSNGVEKVQWSVPLGSAATLFGNLRIAPNGQLRSPSIEIPELGITMIGLPNRSFYMGSSTYESGRYADEGPQFTASFTARSWMAEREITQAQYTALMTNNPSWSPGDDLPVDGVTWDEANEFCRRLTARESAAGRLPRGYAYRLPTEAEWESAARGSGVDYNGYPLSSTGWIPQQNAWYAANSSFQTHPVGSKLPNSWGLFDMEGNVAEWCSDWYGSYPFTSAVDPVGPVSGLYRVVRGGSFIDGPTALRVAARNGALPSQGSRFIGFRVVLGVSHE